MQTTDLDLVPAPVARERPRARGQFLSRRRLFAAGSILTLVLMVAGSAAYAWAIQGSYRDARSAADDVQARYAGADAGTLRPDDLPRLTEDLAGLESDLKDLQGLVDAPLLGGIASHAPIVGDQVGASQDLLDLGVELTAIAREASELANEVRLTFEASGMTSGSGVAGPTWLDAVRERRTKVDELERRFDAALVDRAALDVDHLPERGKNLLPRLDALLERATGIRAEYFGVLPLLDTAFGADTDARYLIVLQNREEIRPGGGFPGTIATVTLSDGRLASYEGDDIRSLDIAYAERAETPIVSPGPIREVLGQEEFLPHDAFWSPDFAESARTFLAMYQTAGLPELTGVIALSDSAVQQVLSIIGPYQVDIDGTTQTVSADSFLALIESYRDLSWQDLAAHKRVVAQLGASLIEQVRAADFATKKQVYFALRDAADRREVQVYMTDPAMQAEVVARGWDGALNPQPDTPTMAMTVAGLTGGKKALQIYASSDIQLAPAAGGSRVRWTIALEHRGDRGGHQVYNGYEYAWVSLYLPDGARVLASSRDQAASEIAGDPRAISFGIGLMPGTTETLTVEFEMPRGAELLLRRQSGLNDVAVRVTGDTGSCAIDWSFALTRDQLVDLAGCTASPAR
jgi:hypothetical protein